MTATPRFLSLHPRGLGRCGIESGREALDEERDGVPVRLLREEVVDRLHDVLPDVPVRAALGQVDIGTPIDVVDVGVGDRVGWLGLPVRAPGQEAVLERAVPFPVVPLHAGNEPDGTEQMAHDDPPSGRTTRGGIAKSKSQA
jgi:hypothetical protein